MEITKISNLLYPGFGGEQWLLLKADKISHKQTMKMFSEMKRTAVGTGRI